MAGDTADKQECNDEILKEVDSETIKEEITQRQVHIEDDSEDSPKSDNGGKQNKTTDSANSNNNSRATAKNDKEVEDKTQETKRTQYLQNIKMSNSSAGLVLSEKDVNLLSDSNTVVRFSPVWRQTITAASSILLTFTAGLTSGYSAILLPQLEQPNSPIPIDLNTKSWIALLMLVPESPTWLISKGEEEEGIKSFQWLRGYGDEAKVELKGIIDSKKALSAMPAMTWKEKIVSLKSPELLKPLFIMIMFFIACQFSGVNAVAFYSIQMVESAVGKGLNHYVVMLIIDSVRVLMSVVACIVCKKYGRRPLCFISGIWTSVSMIGLSMFLYFRPDNMSWLPLTCLMMYICAVSIGFVPLPWIMCGEVFPTKVRGLGSGISSATTFAAFFIVVKTAPGMMTHMGEVLTFLFYGTVSLIGTAVMFFILPETKGKSLQEIEERFKNGKTSGPKV
ncbi:hypothetical protein ACJJTC_007471 [Scirpophaga incertulas]